MQRHWAAFTLASDDHLPLDLSFLYADEKPAGKHGFLTARGSRFVFEDGTEGRFWGTNFNSGANFPPHDYSEMVARRLAKFGVNMVRTHQMDAEWSTPNIFQFNRAKPQDHTRSLDLESLERLDYLIYCLKQEGVYLYLDMLTYRQFLPGDEVDNVGQLPQAAKPYAYFDPRLIELQKEFNRQLWTHVNPYTGLAYKDDPAIALTEIVNESDPFQFPVALEPYRWRLEDLYRAWGSQEGIPITPEAVDFRHPTGTVARFLVEVMKKYYREMISHLRSFGVKIPITGTNWTINLGVTDAQSAADFTDSHCYWNFPLWESEQGTATIPMVSSASNTFSGLSMMRSLEKPFLLSEWDHAWPDEWRAESPLTYAAVAAFQGWGGATIHTYRYSTWPPQDRLGGGAQTINSITYRNHFDAHNDPAKFGLFYQAALLLRRGDVQPALHSAAIHVSEQENWPLMRAEHIPALALIAEKHRLGMELPGQTCQADLRFPADQPSLVPDAGEILSDTGELWRSWVQRIGWIDTPRTKAAYGFLGEVEQIRLQGLELKVKTDFAVMAISSLSNDPIHQAEALLLTAVGRSDNTEARYDEKHSRQLDFGRAPILIEPIQAQIKLTTHHPYLKVWLISDKGEAVTRLPTEYQNGVLSFEIGAQPTWNPSTIYYLLTL